MVNQENGVDLKSATQSDERKLFIETYGCQMNVADSEVVSAGKASVIAWHRRRKTLLQVLPPEWRT